MTARVLVTGATGSIGRNLVKELVHRGNAVRAGIHTPDKAEYIKMSGVEPVKLDFADNSTLDKALESIDSVFLLTPFAREQVEFTRRLVDRCRLWEVTHIVKLSMMGANEEPGTRFTRWHREAERYIEQSGIAYTFLRPNQYMQNFVRYVQPSGSFLYMPLDNARVSYIDVRDVALVAAHILIAGKEYYGRILELTGRESLSIDEITDILTMAVGSHIGYVNIPEDTARHAMESLGSPSWMTEGMLELYALQREGKNERITHDVENILGRKPRTFAQFAHDFENVFRAIVQQEHHTYLR